MLWYLLYPLRGTTEPIRFSPNHPVRRAFYMHGRTTSQHWLIALLVAVAIAMAFSYPTILLTENPTAGFATFPNHAWTTAKSLDEEHQHADLEMRQVWVHGSYMKALDKDVLSKALDIQQILVGGEPLSSIPALDDKLRSSTLDWGYHSPLMYWNNSHEQIENDIDILRTINDKRRKSSSLNISLRPASVFAGKKFRQSTLIAADALVITLINKVQDGIGDKWQRRMGSVTNASCADCMLFPRDGIVTRSNVYEFAFTPLSLQENVALAIAYGFMAVYVLLSLRRLKAFHSRFGLVVTAITQMTFSILASFTICGILKINLSMIPQSAYPFVVLVMGIENMFRIINAVEAYPATMATELRIANALGDVGPVSGFTAIQNIVILSLLGRVVSPGVAAFCVFAGMATLFDTYFLHTFFIAVLSVDIRRFELQDALSKANANQIRNKRKPPPVHHHTWFDALVHGRLPFSTRMAGTAVTTTFVISLNFHFFEHKEKAMSLRNLLRLLMKGAPTLNEFESFAPPPMNASLTPGQWMRMQDFDTAKEVMRLAKPGADSFIVRVFAPLIVVLAGADRTDITEEEAWTSALRSFAVHHFYRVAIAVIFAVAFVAVLMNFLLYTEHPEERGNRGDEQDQDSVKVDTIALPHKLDIVKIAASQKGSFVSVGLDRTIAISTLDASQRPQRIMGFPAEALAAIQWPIRSITLDDTCEWVACHCANDQIQIYCCAKAGFVGTPIAYPDDNPPVLFRFVRLPSPEGSQLHFMVLTSGGRLGLANIDTGATTTKRLETTSLLGASIQEHSSQGRRLVVFTDQALIVAYAWTNGAWVQSISQSLPIPTLYGRMTGAVRLEQNAELSQDVCIIITTRHIVFLDAHTFAVLGRICAEEDDSSISGVMLGQSAQCSHCASLAFRYVAFCTDDLGDNSNECTVTTLSAEAGEDVALCLKSGDAACVSFDAAERTKQKLAKAGAWSLVASSQAILGLRKQIHSPTGNGVKKQESYTAARRRRNTRGSRPPVEDSDDVWEAFRFSPSGEVDVVLDQQHHDEARAEGGESLYVSSAGPAVPLDGTSVAVAFGNTVKIVKSTRRGSMVRRPTTERELRPYAGVL